MLISYIKNLCNSFIFLLDHVAMLTLYIKYYCSRFQVMLFATIAYVVCLVGIILIYIWYALQPSCLNIFFITCTLVLFQLMMIVSLALCTQK